MTIRNHTYGPLRPSKLALMGVRFLDGPEGAAQAAEPAAPIVEPAGAPEAPKPTPPAEPAPVETFDAAYVKKLRDEAAAARVNGRSEAETAAKAASEAAYKELGQKLGLVAAEEESTVESLSAAIQEKDSTITTQAADIKATRLENALIRAVTKHSGDLDPITDSASFQAKLAAIDTTDTEYRSLVDELVKTSIESNPKFRAVQVAPRSGGDTPPAGAGSHQLTRAQFAELSPVERLKAHSEGRTRGFTKV